MNIVDYRNNGKGIQHHIIKIKLSKYFHRPVYHNDKHSTYNVICRYM